MSPHMQDTIKTPFFMFNSKYDGKRESYGILKCIKANLRCVNNLEASYDGQLDYTQR